MARLGMGGAETGDVAISSPDGSGITGAVTSVTSPVHGGARAYKFDSAAGAAATILGVKTSAGLLGSSMFGASITGYMRAYLCFGNLPTAGNVGVFGTQNIHARLTTGGKVQLWNAAAGTQIGSDSAATITADGATWYRFELSAVYNASSQITDCELRLDGVTVATGSGLAVATVNQLRLGWAANPGASKIMYADDWIANDNSGASHNTWPDAGELMVLLKPISDSAVGSGWTDDAGSGANIFDAVANTPPVGIADTTASTGLHQIRNASSNTASYDANLTSYTTAGIGASDTVEALLPIISVAAPASTGAKSGNVGIPSNPTIAQKAFALGSGTATFFWRGTAAGTYPTGWGWEVGTLTELPTVTLGTSPVARVTITGGTATRIAMSCALMMYVGYTPAAAATTSLIYQPALPTVYHL